MANYAKIKVIAVAKDKDGPVEGNPYRKGTAKKEIFDWALAATEENGHFTKAQFIEAISAKVEAGDVESKMPPETCAKAWWNEFYNKYKVFELVKQ